MYHSSSSSSSNNTSLPPTAVRGLGYTATLPPINSSNKDSCSLPPLVHSESTATTVFYPYSQHQQQPQKSTYSYSPYLDSGSSIHIQQHEEYYYPVYNKHEWTEDLPPPMIDNPKLKKKKDMDERMKSIDNEFMENREVLYSEKMKQLQDEIIAVEKGNHDIYDECLQDLEEKRKKVVDEARLMMIYQISTVEQQFQLNYKIVQEESMAERREIQNAMFTVIEEKRRKLKQDKDGELDTGHQTRNNRMLLRKKQRKKKNECVAYTPSVLTTTIDKKEDIEADFYAMTAVIKRSIN